MAVLFPATIGFHDFSEGQDNQATMTFVPGVRFDFPVFENWWLYKFGIALSSKDKFPVFGLFDLGGGGLDETFGDGYFGMRLTTGFPF